MKRKKKLLPPSVELDDESLGQVTGGAMIVNHNMAAMNTLTQLNKNQNTLSKSLAKLSSGMKINSAADDPSGYQISERMRVQIRSLDQMTLAFAACLCDEKEENFRCFTLKR